MAETVDVKCPHAAGCEMYSLFKLAGALAVWKTNYCAGDYTRCARYMATERGDLVAANLLPNGTFLRKPGDTNK